MPSDLQTRIEQIIDGLADNGYAIADGFLTDDEVDSILQTDEFSGAKLHFKKAGIGKQHNKQINEAIRGDFIQWIDPAAAPRPMTVYFERLRQLIVHVNQTLFLSLHDAEIHMTLYP